MIQESSPCAGNPPVLYTAAGTSKEKWEIMRSNLPESLKQDQQKPSANRRLKEAEAKNEALLAKNAELEERAAALSAELLEAREKLQRAEYTVLGENELLRSVLSQAGVTVFNEGKDLKINWMLNPFPNFSDPDPEGKTEAEVMPLPDAVYIMDLKREVIESGVGSRTDIWLHVGGDLCYYDYVVEPIRDGSGVVCGVLGSAVDITERKNIFDALRQAEGALRRSERQLLQALEAAQMVAWEWDPETGEVAQRSSLPPSWVDPLSGEDFLSLIHPEDVEQFVQKIQTAYKEKSYFVDEFRVRANHGEYRWVEGRGRVVQKGDDQKEQVEGLAIDITERKLNEQVLREYFKKP